MRCQDYQSEVVGLLKGFAVFGTGNAQEVFHKTGTKFEAHIEICRTTSQNLSTQCLSSLELMTPVVFLSLVLLSFSRTWVDSHGEAVVGGSWGLNGVV